MTDKQIIIDGVDVSGCCHYNKKTGICSNGFRADEIPYCNCFTCNYKRWKVAEKQLKAKEQECEELKELVKKQKDVLIHKTILADEYEFAYLFENTKVAKLKYCLTEIKEIVFPKNQLIITDSPIILKIQQKISECEGNDE